MAAASIRNGIFNKLLFSDLIGLRQSVVNVRCYSGNARFGGKRFRQSNVGLIALGVGGGAVVGAGLSWFKFLQVKPPVLNNAMGRETVVLPDLPDVRIARKVRITRLLEVIVRSYLSDKVITQTLPNMASRKKLPSTSLAFDKK